MSNLLLEKMSHYLTSVGLMTYDLYGSWDDTVGFHTLLYKDQEKEDSVPDNNNKFVVTVANDGGGNAFYIDGTKQKQLLFRTNNTYEFDVSDSSMSGHTFYITNSKIGGSVPESDPSNVTVIYNSSVETIYVTITSSIPNNYLGDKIYYQCGNHEGMGGSISTKTDVLGNDIFWSTNDATLYAINTLNIKPSKLNIGIAFYGRGWKSSNAFPDGNSMHASEKADGTLHLDTAGVYHGGSWEHGVWDYKHIKELIDNGHLTEFYDSAETKSVSAFGTYTDGGVTTHLWIGYDCLLYTSPSPRDRTRSRMPSSA